MHNFAQRDVVDVAVNETRSGRAAQRLAIQTLDRLVIAGPPIAQIEIGSKARHVGKQLFDRDRVAPFTFHFGDKLSDRIA